MANEQIPDDFDKLWQNQPQESPGVSLDDLRRKMDRFKRRIFWRNIREYVAGAIVVAWYSYYAWRFSGLLLRFGSGLTIAGALYVMYQLHRRGSAEPAPADLGRSTYVEFHRSELVRQRDALRTVWSWYLLPFVPGLAVFLAGLARSAMNTAQVVGHPLSALQVAGFVTGSASFVVVVFVGVWMLNRWSVTKLQAQIDELDVMARDSGVGKN